MILFFFYTSSNNLLQSSWDINISTNNARNLVFRILTENTTFLNTVSADFLVQTLIYV